MLSVKTVMNTNVITVTEDTSIYEALRLLSEKRISGMPVVDNNNSVVGILSEKDVLRILLDDNVGSNNVVGDFMSHDVISFTEEDNAIDVCKFFIKSHVRRVPIVKDGKLVGIVSRRDIVNLILEYKSKTDSMRLV